MRTKIIDGRTVRRNSEHPRVWDVMESRGGQPRGKVAFTGTLKEIRVALRLGKKAGER